MNEQPIRILIVEDEETHAELVRRAFETYGNQFHLTTVSSLKKAQGSLAESQPDLVIADLFLPDGRGIELLPAAEEEPPFPMVMMTSHGNEQVAVEAMRAGALDYIVKSATSLADMPRITERALREWSHITKRKRAEQALRETHDQLEATLSALPDTLFEVDRHGRFYSYRAPSPDLLYTSPQNFLGKTVQQVLPKESAAVIMKAIEQVVETGHHIGTTFSLETPAGVKWFELSIAAKGDPKAANGRLIVMARDITDRIQLEDQLRQAQKMEAVGRLTSGVAHDFNNILTVIFGNCSFMLRDLDQGHPLRQDVEQIQMAAKRAAALTRQLLAFSRQQVLQPEVLSLNNVVSNIEKMLQRLIGEDIALETILEAQLGQVKTDPGQIEQVIMNLAVNARDSMIQGGKLSIETANVYLDEAYARQHVNVAAGPYIMLAVSDTGIGMDAETRDRIFEPFFSTKELEKGTGLGLATVHGIINQSGGHIWVYSEPGHGTVFKIYLPQIEAAAKLTRRKQPPVKSRQGWETILLVEDEDTVRELARRTLLRDGYTVLEADDGEQARRVAAEHKGPIHLLLSDVVMPGGMSGPQLAESLAAIYPEMKVFYISGYTNNAIMHHGVLAPDVAFLQKPFTPNALSHKVRQTLDEEKL